ncbi:RagB/SusD family nutrient uptake outer membrane protein [Echinicola strongylocentroti]|uniref:RagB/SusD family nutrient uptake outer membrane protein n=1 Tax=Echinicola strongylocentroti TaxID=1795355 RepID=A0A2Z4IFP2_9BACT|nr:RagB/SusD family nutrient uptake outer membrane protein [Echinicola strongylocentroti]AWW29705.1 RagB/SusD family nutrient uptake outer membrane protein [Echinicola strongylocentroti]
MKGLKNLKYKVLIMLVAVFGGGCTDFLDEKDRSNFTLENYFTKPEHATSVVNAIYESLRPITQSGFGGGAWMMTEFATGLADTDLGQAQYSLFVKNLINNSDNGYGQTYWTNYYRGIANANLAIDQIPAINMDEGLKSQLLGEAYFMRAYYYFHLVRLFGNIPLITEPIDLSSDQLLASPADPADVYNTIVADLLEAEKTGLAFRDPTGRASMGAVKTMLASVYLTMAGYPLQMGDEYYSLAAEKAEEVIDSGEFSLFASYDDLHEPAQKNLGENIFMIQFAPYLMPSTWQVSIIPYNRGISNYSAETGGIFADENFVKAYPDGDKRAEEKAFYYTSYSLRSDRDEVIELGDYYLFKHFDEEAQTNTTSSGLNWPVMRYAEALLIFAEASNEAEGPNAKAYDAVNEIRERAGLDPLAGLSKEVLREEIWKEKWFELSFENKTWFDMVRLRKAFNVTTGQFEDYVGHQFVYGPVLKERELLFPIPTAEIRNNPNLVQNTGY